MKNTKLQDGLLLLGRILLGAIFIWAGYNKLINISGVATYAGLANWQILVAGVAELVGGFLLVVGGCVHIGALILSLYLVVVTVMMHMPLTDDANNTVHFLKNLSILGGLIYVMAFGGGKHQIFKCKCDK